MVMQLRDEGRLSLDDLLGDHVPEVSHPITIRQCLAHVSGMAREPLGDVWETLENPTAKELRRDFDDVERVLRPHQHWHYSNVVFAMLGQLIEELDGRSWEESLRTRLAPAARDAADEQRLRRRPPRDRLLRPAVRRRAAPGAGDGPQGTRPVRRARQHGRRPGEVVRVRRRPGRPALGGHDRGDVPAADPADHGQLERRDGPRPVPDPDPDRSHVRRPHRRHARAHHRACSPTASPAPAASC